MGRYSYSQPSSSKASWPDSYWDEFKHVDKPTPRSGIPLVCNCGLVPVTQTSTTDLNPGRVFYGCKNHKDGGSHVFKWWDEALIEEIHDLRYAVNKQSSIIQIMGCDADAEAKLSEKLSLIQSSVENLKEAMVEKLDGGNYWKNTVVSVDLKHVFVAVIIIIGLISYLLSRN